MAPKRSVPLSTPSSRRGEQQSLVENVTEVLGGGDAAAKKSGGNEVDIAAGGGIDEGPRHCQGQSDNPVSEPEVGGEVKVYYGGIECVSYARGAWPDLGRFGVSHSFLSFVHKDQPGAPEA